MSVESDKAKYQDQQTKARALFYGLRNNAGGDMENTVSSFANTFFPQFTMTIEYLTFTFAFDAQIVSRRNDQNTKMDTISFVGQNIDNLANERGIGQENAETYLMRIVHKGYELADTFMAEDRPVEQVWQEVEAAAQFFKTLQTDF